MGRMEVNDPRITVDNNTLRESLLLEHRLTNFLKLPSKSALSFHPQTPGDNVEVLL